MKKLMTAFWAVCAFAATAEYNSDVAIAASIRDVVVRQQWPWATTITTTFRVAGLESGDLVDVALTGRADGETIAIPPEAVRGVRKALGNGEYMFSFDPADVPGLAGRKSVANFQMALAPARSEIRGDEPLYMIVDLEAATPETAVSYLTRGDILSGQYGAYERTPAWIVTGSTPALDDCLMWTGVTNGLAYKTAKFVLRKVKAGTFTMGSPAGELGRTQYASTYASCEDLHPVTLTRDFWIGVFELTQGQYAHVMDGANPSKTKGETRPVECVSYDNIRGAVAGAGWPGSADVDADSFLGRLRARTNRAFDLPTEAQWEYACRAGTTSALNDGRNLTNELTCPNVAVLGCSNTNTGHKSAGSYRPNAWGLYDMHGNVREWCRDWYQERLGTAAVTDPVGAASGTAHIIRSGSHQNAARLQRSASRLNMTPSTFTEQIGFRVFCPAE